MKGAGASSMRPCESQPRPASHGDPNGEEDVDRDFDIDPAADARLDHHRHQREGDRADGPEPGDPERADPLPGVGANLPDHR